MFTTMQGSSQSDSPQSDAPQGQPSSPLSREVQLDDMSDSDSDASGSAYSDDGSDREDAALDEEPNELDGVSHGVEQYVRAAPLGPTREQKEVSVVTFVTTCMYGSMVYTATDMQHSCAHIALLMCLY
jgi:hypothetical protein